MTYLPKAELVGKVYVGHGAGDEALGEIAVSAASCQKIRQTYNAVADEYQRHHGKPNLGKAVLVSRNIMAVKGDFCWVYMVHFLNPGEQGSCGTVVPA